MDHLAKLLKNYPYRIILASASPRRQELLRSLGFDFVCKPLSADESVWPAELRAHEIPLFLARMKAEAYPEPLQQNELLITSDTVVWCNDRVFNKPVDFEDARRMLLTLSGKMHEVFTAVCLRTAKGETLFYDTSRVYFKTFSEEEIVYYLDTHQPYDKAGAYGAQDWMGYIGIEKIEGSFYNVMGLPVKKLYEHLVSLSAG